MSTATTEQQTLRNQSGRVATRLRNLTQSFRVGAAEVLPAQCPPSAPPKPASEPPPSGVQALRLHELPPEILQVVFGYLSARDLARIQLVCRAWMDVARVDAIWAPHVELLGDSTATRRTRRIGTGRMSLAGLFAARRNEERPWRSGRYDQKTVTSHSANVEMVQLVSLVSPYGRCIVSGGWDGQLLVQPVRSSEELEREAAMRVESAANSLRSSEARSPADSADSNDVEMPESVRSDPVQAQIQRQLHTLLQAYRGSASPHGGWISCMDVSSNGRFIVSGACDGTLCLWRVVVLVMGEGSERGTRFVVEQEAEHATAGAPRSTGAAASTASSSSTADARARSHMVMLSSPRHVLVLPESVVRLPSGVAISSCKFVHDTCVVAGSSDCFARVFCRIDHGAAGARRNQESGGMEVRSEWILLRTLYGHNDCVWSTLPIPNQRLVTASRDGRAIVHDVRDCYRVNVSESNSGVHAGETRRAGRGDRVTLFRDEPPNHDGGVLNNNAGGVRTGDDGGSTTAEDLQPSYLIESRPEALLCMEQGYNGSLLAFGSADKTLCVWDLQPTEPPRMAAPDSVAPMPMRVAKCKHRHGVLSVSFVTRWRSMATIAAGCANGDVAIWVLHERAACADGAQDRETDRVRSKYAGVSLVSVLTHNKNIPSIVCHHGVLVIVSPGDGVYARMLDIDATKSVWRARRSEMSTSTCTPDSEDAPEALPEALMDERASIGCYEASVVATREEHSKRVSFNTCAMPLHFNMCVSMLDGIHVGGSHCVALDDRYLVFGTNTGDLVRLDFG